MKTYEGEETSPLIERAMLSAKEKKINELMITNQEELNEDQLRVLVTELKNEINFLRYQVHHLSESLTYQGYEYDKLRKQTHDLLQWKKDLEKLKDSSDQILATMVSKKNFL